MNNAAWLPVVVTALLSAGGAAFLGSVVKGWTTLRTGARARERETITDLGADRDRAVEGERVALADARFWQRIAGRYGYQLVQAGINPDPEVPEPPSERTTKPARR